MSMSSKAGSVLGHEAELARSLGRGGRVKLHSQDAVGRMPR
jgi:hypothetical protein